MHSLLFPQTINGEGGCLLARGGRREAMVGARNTPPRGTDGGGLFDLHGNHPRDGEVYYGSSVL